MIDAHGISTPKPKGSSSSRSADRWHRIRFGSNIWIHWRREHAVFIGVIATSRLVTFIFTQWLLASIKNQRLVSGSAQPPRRLYRRLAGSDAADAGVRKPWSFHLSDPLAGRGRKGTTIGKKLSLAYHERTVMLLAVGYADPTGGIPHSDKKTEQDLIVFN
jgi:hypothetical protein